MEPQGPLSAQGGMPIGDWVSNRAVRNVVTPLNPDSLAG